MKKKIKSIRPLARELGNVGCRGQTPSLHGVEAGCVAIDPKTRRNNQPCLCVLEGEGTNSAEEPDWGQKGDRIREPGRKQRVRNASRRG